MRKNNDAPEAEGWFFYQAPDIVTFEECEETREQLSDCDFWSPDIKYEYLVVNLSGSAKAYSFPFIPPQTLFTGDWKNLRILCKVSKKHSATYLQSLLCSEDGAEIMSDLRECVKNGSSDSLKNTYIDLPTRYQQIQEWVTTEWESQTLYKIREQVSRPDTNKLTLSQKRQVTRLKISSLSQLVGGGTKKLKEFGRVIHPLPYFFEYPILQWERANEKMAFSNAVSLLQQLIKISCLIGFEEALANKSTIGLHDLLGNELIGQIKGRPSLGTWSKTLDALEKSSQNFHVWKDWFGALASKRKARIRLIEIRNRISHPEVFVEESELDEAVEAFNTYFWHVIPKLRSAYAGTETIISHSRKSVRSNNGDTKIVLDCENFNTPIEPFPRFSYEMKSTTAARLSDDCLTSLRGEYAVELQRFFRIKPIKASMREIYLYDREYSGNDAIWSGITTAQSGKLETSTNLFG